MTQRDLAELHPAAEIIWEAVKACDGAPVSRTELEALTGLHDRLNREIIHDLNKAGFPIVSVEHAPGGYKVGDRDECEAAAAVLRAKARSMYERAAGLDKVFEVITGGEQEAMW